MLVSCSSHQLTKIGPSKLAITESTNILGYYYSNLYVCDLVNGQVGNCQASDVLDTLEMSNAERAKWHEDNLRLLNRLEKP